MFISGKEITLLSLSLYTHTHTHTHTHTEYISIYKKTRYSLVLEAVYCFIIKITKKSWSVIQQ